jgi:endonuclease YncB( thermonuclease family)
MAAATSLMAVAVAAQAQTVVDGDTIKLNGTTWRLWGIDAPESRQWCGRYPAGARATEMLDQLMRAKSINCEERGIDQYGRTIGLCRANGDDLGATMVRLGQAWAFVRYSRDYVEQETKAKADKLGVHAHPCVPAWEWRAQLRAAPRQ